MQIPGYRIIRKINQGGMSTVYLAIQISVGRVVALKVMSPTLNGDPAFSERFQREANIVGQLSHPNIVSIYDIGRHESLNYIAMDYLPGGSVHERMITGLTGEEALRVTREIASALDHAHSKGYIHRDIKPENILFRADKSAVLSDFGVAKVIVGVSRMTSVGQVVGTPHYMSPEQTRGKPVDARSDLYSLGVVMYEMLTGSVPFQGDDAVAIAIKHLSAPIPKLPLQYQAYQKILNKLLDKDPEQRFHSGRELASAIELMETSTRIAYSTTTHAAELSTQALLKVLLLTTTEALRRQTKTIFRLRWTPQRGLYQHPEARVTEVLILGSEDDRSTSVSTRIQQATYFKSLRSLRQRMTSRILTGAIMLGVIWGGLSVATEQFNVPGEKFLPSSLRNLAHETATIFVIPTLENGNQPASVKNSLDTASAEQSASEQTSGKTSKAVNTHLSTSVAEQKTETLPTISLSQSVNTLDTTPPASTEVAPVTFVEKIAPPRYSLIVDTIPSNARVRILNIAKRYNPGIQLEAGRYHLEISHPGFETTTEWIVITDRDFQPSYTLEKIIPPSKNFVSNLSGSKRGPEMVRIPVGSFVMGHKNYSTSTPVHNVTIDRPFAISKYEITFDEYEMFALAVNRALPGDNRWGRKTRPVINVSWEDAKAYAIWLSKMSGKTYRLPTESEWEYVARAGNRTLFWWGDDPKDAIERANCRRGCYSSFSGLFGSKTAPVGSYPANTFGIYDTAGNVAEWVQDCYADNYARKPKDGRPYESSNCTRRVVRGGSAKNNVDQLASHLRDHKPPAAYEDNLGFRVVMELD